MLNGKLRRAQTVRGTGCLAKWLLRGEVPIAELTFPAPGGAHSQIQKHPRRQAVTPMLSARPRRAGLPGRSVL